LPAGTDLSGLDMDNNNGEYFVYILRSRIGNNGVFRIVTVDDTNDELQVACEGFLDETGVAGDTTALSAIIGLPVSYMKYSHDPDNEKVILDGSADVGITRLVYFGDPDGTGFLNATPANFNIVDGFDLEGVVSGSGVWIQSSSLNVFQNGSIVSINGPGAVIAGNINYPANYNLLQGLQIEDVAEHGVLVGNPAFSQYYNHAHGNIIKGIQVTGGTARSSELISAFSISHFNRYNVIEQNSVDGIQLSTPGYGSVFISDGTHGTLCYTNSLKDISTTTSGLFGCFYVEGPTDSVQIYNNIAYNTSVTTDSIYFAVVEGSGHVGSHFIHNSSYNLHQGFCLVDLGSVPEFDIVNNIVNISTATYFNHIGAPGRFEVGYNCYNNIPESDPGDPYYSAAGRQVGDPAYNDPINGDLSITSNSWPVIGTGLFKGLVNRDIIGVIRSTEATDIGAYERAGKFIWMGTTDSDWHTATNWNTGIVPGSQHNIIIINRSNQPIISDANGACKSIVIKSPALLTLRSNKALQIGE
jgi:hypothetical protein